MHRLLCYSLAALSLIYVCADSVKLYAQADALKALDGEWIFVEDLTEGRTLEQLSAPMSSRFSLGVEEAAIVLNGHGSGHRDIRVALDGSVTKIEEPKTITSYKGSWKRRHIRV